MSIWKHFQDAGDTPSDASKKVSLLLAVVVCILVFSGVFWITDRLLASGGIAFSLLAIFISFIVMYSK